MLQETLDFRSETGPRGTMPRARARHGRSAIASRAEATCLEFFAGSGLVTEALAGTFRVVWANDIEPKKAAVYRANHGSEYFALGSICDVSGADLPAVDMAWASFPCQDLSLAGLTGGITAKRSGLVWEWLRVIDEMQSRPRLLVAENVLGLVSAAAGQNYRQLHDALVERGYRAGAMVLDAVHWVPHSRPRVFIVAVDDDVQIPNSLLAEGASWLQPEPVKRAALGLDQWVWWSLPPPPARSTILSDLIEWEECFLSAEESEQHVELISPKHARLLSAASQSEQRAFPGYRRTRSGKQVLELRFDDVAGCLRTPSGGSSRQIIVAKIDGRLRSRLLTVRETARLMGAPETYKIPGSYNDGYAAMGDAVALPVARWLSENLLSPLALSYAAE
jgi:DNA (cytosine-5)-methyltransferase 1